MAEYSIAPPDACSPPDSPEQSLTCGIQFLTDFWKEKYLQEYIKTAARRLNLSPGGREAARPIFSAS